jgi:hypothetical protein
VRHPGIQEYSNPDVSLMCPEADVEKKYAWKLGMIFAWTLCGYAAVLGPAKTRGDCATLEPWAF